LKSFHQLGYEVDADGEIINKFNEYGYDSYGIYNNAKGFPDLPEYYSDGLGG